MFPRDAVIVACLQSKKPRHVGLGFLRCSTLTMTYFHAVYPALSSALRRFTVLFGMGRRGSNALWSSENSVAGLWLSRDSVADEFRKK